MPDVFLTPLDKEGKERLKSCKIKLPTKLPASRPFTAADLIAAVAELPDNYAVKFDPVKPKPADKWYLDIEIKDSNEEESAIIEVNDFPGLKKALPHVYFVTGWPRVMYAVAVQLAKLAGPLLLDGECGPKLITAEDDPDHQASETAKRTANYMKRLKKRSGGAIVMRGPKGAKRMRG